jgi:hypothetical protein
MLMIPTKPKKKIPTKGCLLIAIWGKINKILSLENLKLNLGKNRSLTPYVLLSIIRSPPYVKKKIVNFHSLLSILFKNKISIFNVCQLLLSTVMAWISKIHICFIYCKLINTCRESCHCKTWHFRSVSSIKIICR